MVLILIILFPLIVWYIVAQPTFTKENTPSDALHIKAENLKHQVYTITEKFEDRGYTNIEVLDKTAKYIYDELSQYSERVEYQTFKLKEFVDEVEYEYKNVIAHFKGQEACDEEVYVVGAHYDTFGGFVGANDNTSSVAGILELARVLKEHPPKCNLQIVAYTLEEPPAFGSEKMGSFIHAQSLHKAKVKVKLAIALDMIGFYSDEENSQLYPVPLMNLYYPKKANFISVVSDMSWGDIKATRKVKDALKESSDLSVYSINAPAIIPGIDFSDHRNYWKFSYPALMISDTAFYRSDNYHTAKDTPDTLNYKNMAKVMEGVFRFLTKT